jgi:PAS domain S-box-containing protein
VSKKTKILLLSSVFIILFVVVGFFAAQNVYRGFLDRLIDQYAQEKLSDAKQLAATLTSEIDSDVDKLNLMGNIPEIRDPETEPCNAALASAAKLSPRISNIGRVGLDRKFVCSLNKAIIGTDAQNLGPYIAEIFDDPEHKPVMSRIIKVPNGGYAVAVHVPVYNEKGEFDGTIGGAIYFDQFNEKFLKDIFVSKNGYMVLQDDDGTIFYHPQTDLIGQNRRPKNEEELAKASEITKLIIESSQDGSTGISRYVSTLDNKEKVGAYAPAEIFPGRRWIVLATVPIEDIQSSPLIVKSRSSFGQMFLLVLASIILLPILLLVYLVLSIFRPLDKVRKAALQIGEGNLDISIPVTTHDEIGELGRVFNQMSGKLHDLYSNLENKVKERTQELEAKDRELEDAQNAGDVGTFVWDVNAHAIDISSHVYAMYGLLPSSGMQPIENFLSLVHPQDRDAVGLKMSEIPRQEGPFELSYRCVWPDGTIRWLQARGRTVYSMERKTPSEVIGTIHDITKEKELEKLKDEFVSIASHELRTPMGAIRSFTSMLLSGDYGPVNDNLKEPLIDIKTNTERLVSLVNDLLNVARIESGRMKFTLTETNISNIVKEVVQSLVPLAEEKKLELRFMVSETPKVQLDVDKVKQVFTNLIGNSLKFTDEGGITVDAQVVDGMVEVSIIDTGVGISQEDQKKLFGKFAQANVMGDRPAGTGLGLYLSRELIQKMGGDLWIKSSEVGKGTTFAFTLPIVESEKASNVKATIEKEAEVHTDQK